MEAPLITLQRGDWRAVIAPAVGGAITAFELAGTAILRPTPAEAVSRGEVRRTACYPLLPYANRIARGQFNAHARNYKLRPNFPDGHHPLHGVGWRRAWRVLAADATSCEIALSHLANGEDALDWPFPFEARQRVALCGEGLRIDLKVVNLAQQSAPLGLGLHPWFVRRRGETLAFEAEAVWENDAEHLPARRVDAAIDAHAWEETWDHSRGRAVGAAPLDHDFGGWRGLATMTATEGARLQMRADAVFPVLRVFTPPGREEYAVEPMTHGTDALHRHGPAVAPMAWRAPGEAFEGGVTIAVQPPAAAVVPGAVR